MHKSKLIKLFSGLSRTELLEFGRYLKTPFFNRDKNLLTLYNYVKKFHPKYDSEKIDKEVFAKKHMGGESSKNRKINDWMSDLSSKLEDYLILTETRKKSYARDFLLLDAMKERKMDELFYRSIKNIGAKLENSIERDMFYFFYQWQLMHEAFFYSSTSKKYKDQVDIQRTMEYMDMFFCAVKLRYSGEMMTQQQMLAGKHSIALLDEVRKEIEKPSYDEHSKLFKIYNLTLELFYEKRDETYEELETLIYDQLHLGNIDEKLTLLNFLLAHANSRLGEGDLKYTQKIFDLYVYKINNDLLLEDGYVPATHFINISYLATTLERAEWLKIFISNYEQYLTDVEKENASQLARAYLCFAEGAYKDSLLILRQMGGAYALYTRTLAIQCHYEFETDTDVVILECNNFNKYLNRNDKIADTTKDYPKNFIRFVRILVEAPYKKDVTRDKLQEKLSNTKRIFARYWLHSKINDLKN